MLHGTTNGLDMISTNWCYECLSTQVHTSYKGTVSFCSNKCKYEYEQRVRNRDEYNYVGELTYFQEVEKDIVTKRRILS